MNKNPNYLYLTIGLLTAVVLVTSVHPQSLLMTVGVSVVALTFMVTSYFVIESRRQLLLAALLGMSDIETILQELTRTYPDASKLTPESIIDASIVKAASL